jgi:hypothetical protein
MGLDGYCIYSYFFVTRDTTFLIISVISSFLITPVAKCGFPPPLPSMLAISLTILLQSISFSTSFLATTIFAVEASSLSSLCALAIITTVLSLMIFLSAKARISESIRLVTLYNSYPFIFDGIRGYFIQIFSTMGF